MPCKSEENRGAYKLIRDAVREGCGRGILSLQISRCLPEKNCQNLDVKGCNQFEATKLFEPQNLEQFFTTCALQLYLVWSILTVTSWVISKVNQEVVGLGLSNTRRTRRMNFNVKLLSCN